MVFKRHRASRRLAEAKVLEKSCADISGIFRYRTLAFHALATASRYCLLN